MNAEGAPQRNRFGPSATRRHSVHRDELGVPITSKPKDVQMQIVSTTWGTDSHGLYDYESRNIYKRTFKCMGFNNQYRILRRDADVEFLPESEAQGLLIPPNNFTTIAKVQWMDGAFYIAPPSPADTAASNDKICLVIRYLKAKQIKISEGDVVKFGRVKLKVKEAVVTRSDAHLSERWHLTTDDDERETVAPETDHAEPASQSSLNGQCDTQGRNDRPLAQVTSPLRNATADIEMPADDAPPNEDITRLETSVNEPDNNSPATESRADPPVAHSTSSLTNGPVCRICLCENIDEGNPMVSPCQCSGSMQYVHLLCLRTWMEGRLDIRHDGSTVCYYWRSLECELCKVPYPSIVECIEAEGAAPRNIELFVVPRPEYPYMILEPKVPNGRGFHVISLASRKIARLGRGHESDIRLQDISVSRLHANIKFVSYASSKEPAAFYLEDKKSKFGTLIELKKHWRLDPNTNLSFQIGRSLLNFQVKKVNKFLPTCFRGSKAQEDVTVTEHPNPMKSMHALPSSINAGANEPADEGP